MACSTASVKLIMTDNALQTCVYVSTVLLREAARRKCITVGRVCFNLFLRETFLYSFFQNHSPQADDTSGVVEWEMGNLWVGSGGRGRNEFSQK